MVLFTYCAECEEYREFKDNICSNNRSNRLLITCNFCQSNFKTFNERKIGCSVCCRLIESKLKTHTFEKFKN